MSELLEKVRKFKGTIRVEHGKWTATFYFGKRGKKELGMIGNVGVAYDFIEMLKKLGHDVEIHDFSDEDEDC